ncbi:MAG: LexA family transcriptional regulator [Clostridia bacterium]|nr:LexA family transcriptional regulator [Clostridia bacterium]
MLGSMIEKIRKDKNITKVELSKRTKINIGHITHIEKGERNPSHKALKSISKALDVPYQNLMNCYDKELQITQKRNNLLDHISYSKIPAVDSISELIDVPSEIQTASFALKVQDDSMAPYLKKDTYAYVELCSPLKNKEVGLFEYDGEFLIRRFIVRKDIITLKPDNKNYDDVYVLPEQDFTIVGKILNL